MNPDRYTRVGTWLRWLATAAVIGTVTSGWCGSDIPKGSPPRARDIELYSGLLSWAEKLSGYPRPRVAPTVEFVPQAFFDKHACNDRPCHVWGWYPNTGRSVVYVHEAAREMIDDGSDPRGLLAASIVVHEFTHYLQAVDRGFASYKCEDALALEHQAYAVQNAFLGAYGRLVPVGVSMHTANCGGNASDNPVSREAMPP